MVQNHHDKNIQLTLEFPFEKYTYLKKLADIHGISVQQYILEFLCANLENDLDLRQKKFKDAMEKVIKEKDGTLRKLADS